MNVVQLLLWVVAVVIFTLLVNIYLHHLPVGIVHAPVTLRQDVTHTYNTPQTSTPSRSRSNSNEILVGGHLLSHLTGNKVVSTADEKMDRIPAAAAAAAAPVATRVLNYSLVPSSNTVSREFESHDDTSYHNYIAKAAATYKALHGHHLKTQKGITLEHYMKAISEQPACAVKPVFMTMARVSSDLYWQLIENFFHTMYYFGNVVSQTNTFIYKNHQTV